MEEAGTSLKASGLKIGFTKDKRFLVALLPKSFSGQKIDRAWVIRQIQAKGLSDLALLDEYIDRLVNLFNSAKTTAKVIPIAERRNAQVFLTVAPDDMSATVTATPAKGGDPVSEDAIYTLMNKENITHGILDHAITLIAAEGEARDVCVAMGTEPQDGEDAKFVVLLPEVKERQPKVREDGSVDYRDLGSIIAVSEGDELMRRIPATKGKPGMDIFGKPIPARPGEDIRFASNLVGAKLSPQDPNLLVAAQKGQPIIVDSGVNIEPTVQYEEVNLRTGNVKFDGSVVIAGDVITGMKIEASGDVHVGGTVEAACITAGGNIVVEGSIIGHGEAYDQMGQLKKDVTCIQAKGSISARYVENVQLIAGDSIFIQEQVIRSSVKALNEIIVGGRFSKNGHIIGGEVLSGILIKANVFGSGAGIRTSLEIDVDADVHKEIEKLTAEIQEALTSKDRLSMNIINLKRREAPAEILAKHVTEKRENDALLNRLTQRKENLKKEVKRVKNGKIVCGKTMHAGTFLRIGKIKKQINEDLKGRTFELLDDRIV